MNAAVLMCVWAFTCDGFGHCGRAQVCDQSYQHPFVAPPAVLPAQPPDVKPVEPAVVPPPGTSSCRLEHVYLNGAWSWMELCE